MFYYQYSYTHSYLYVGINVYALPANNSLDCEDVNKNNNK